MADLIQKETQLLKSVQTTVKKYEDLYRETGIAYNIFKIAGISEKEVRICRVLADLLNPKGLHYKGNAYLKLFLDDVFKPVIEKTGKLDLTKAKVITEYPIDENRRIDIVIEDKNVFIPIEVKIYAGEQEKQITDYAAFSKKMNAADNFIPVVFLTIDGRESYEASKDDYVRISFIKQIISWLEKCLNLDEINKVSPLREILKQLINAIKSFCGCEDGTMENAINTLISESRENFKAALMIKKAVDELGFGFDTKAWEIFKGDICELVKKKIPETEYLEEGAGSDAWYFINISTGNFDICVNYDMRSITIESVNSKKVDNVTKNKINKIMSDFLGVQNENWQGEKFIWACSNVKCPGLEDINDNYLYNYELYHIYSKDPQTAADKITAIANALKNI
jgi:hypothetical protein